jgi:hypothetical protein
MLEPWDPLQYICIYKVPQIGAVTEEISRHFVVVTMRPWSKITLPYRQL